MAKRSPADVLKDIEDSETDDVVEHVMSLSPEHRRQELEAAGYTRAELDAKADALFDRMQAIAVEQGKKQLADEGRARSMQPPGHRRRVVLLVAAALFVAVVLALLLFPRLATQEAPVAVPSASAPPLSSVAAPSPTPSAGPPDVSAAPLPSKRPYGRK